jgi:hypothetical protein
MILGLLSNRGGKKNQNPFQPTKLEKYNKDLGGL